MNLLYDPSISENLRSDEELFLVSQKDPSAYAELVARYEKLFVARAERLLRNREDAEDVAQDTFVKMYLKAGSFVPRGGGSFRSWGYAILFNTGISLIRKRKGILPLLDEWEEFLPDPASLSEQKGRELGDYISSILKRMPESLSAFLTKFFLEGKSQEEIAREEGMSIAAVKSRIHRAKKSFRDTENEISETARKNLSLRVVAEARSL